MSNGNRAERDVTNQLADEIRDSEPAFVAAATAAFKRRFTMEYYRLRGYQVESGHSQITLRIDMHLNFATKERSIVLESFPIFTPEKGVTRASISP